MAQNEGHPASTWRSLLCKKSFCVSWPRDVNKMCIRLP